MIFNGSKDKNKTTQNENVESILLSHKDYNFKFQIQLTNKHYH